DYLSSRGDIDVKRLAFVGHSFGQSIGGVLSGIDRRFTAFVLIAGSGSTVRFWRESESDVARGFRAFFANDPAALDWYFASLEPFEQITYVAQARPASLLFQFATHDEYVSRKDLTDYFAAA